MRIKEIWISLEEMFKRSHDLARRDEDLSE